MLCHQGSVNEIHLKLCGQDHARIPVILNCKKGLFEGVESYFWTFFVSIERDKFEVEILESQRRTESILKTIFHISPNGYLLVDDSHRILFANDMIARLIEHSVQDLYALSSHQFWHYLASHSQKNFSIPQEIGETHYIDLSKPRLIKLVCSMQPIVLSNGNALGSLFYFNDITKEEESNRIKSEFLTHASHELRTPLALIPVSSLSESTIKQIIETALYSCPLCIPPTDINGNAVVMTASNPDRVTPLSSLGPVQTITMRGSEFRDIRSLFQDQVTSLTLFTALMQLEGREMVTYGGLVDDNGHEFQAMFHVTKDPYAERSDDDVPSDAAEDDDSVAAAGGGAPRGEIAAGGGASGGGAAGDGMMF